MRTRQVLPYLAALLLLAWILGSLARSGTGGASILSNSYWLVYLVYLIPFLALGAMVVMIVFLAISWKVLSDALGFGIARKRRMTRKQSNTIRLVVWISFWGLALGTLYWKCGGIFCKADNSTRTLGQTTETFVQGGQGAVFSPFTVLQGPAYALADLISSGWFAIAFFGLLVVSSVILVRGIKVSLDETRAGEYLPDRVREEGTVAVRDALRVLEKEEVADPRTRIMACYERMIRAAASLGADVSVDQTARELESGIRRMFQLKSPSIRDLTRLFEEARYSLHPITEQDSEEAQRCLLEIGEELRATVSVQN